MKKTTFFTRVLALALALCLCVCFCAVAPISFAEEASSDTITITPTTGTAIVVNATNPTATVGTGSVTYDATDKKVILSNVSGLSRIVFAMSADFTVELDGANVIDSISDNAAYYSFESSTAGVSMTVVGGENDSLTIDTPNHGRMNDQKYQKQISVNGDLTLDGGVYTVYGHNYTIYATGDILVEDADLTIVGQSRTLNAVGKLTINNSTVSSTVDTNARWQLAFDNGGFEMNNSDITTNAGGYTLAGAGDIALNSGSITSQDKVFIQTRGDTDVPVTVTVGAGMVLNVTCDTAAIAPKSGTNPVVTISDVGVEYEVGKELTAAATAVKTKPTCDAVIHATVTAGSIGQSGVTVELYKDTAKVSQAVTDANGNVFFTVENLTEGTYSYTLKQIAADDAGLTYDTADKTVTVTVAADLTVTYTGNDAVFTNAYVPGTITVAPTTGDTVIINQTNPTASLATGTVTYDATNNIITLSNVSGLSRIVFAMNADFTVVLDGENIIHSVADNSAYYSFESAIANVDVTIVGGENDSLTITTPTGGLISDTKYQKQISVNGNLTLDGGTYTVIGHNYTVYAAGNILVKDAVLDIVGQSRTLNAVGKLTINNSTVTSTVDTTARWQLGFDNGGFEMNNSDITTNAGGYTLAGAGDIALNSGSITSQDLVFIQTRGATDVPVTVTVGAGMVLNVTCDTAAIAPKSGTNPVVTISDVGVEYETGMELKADATAVVVIDREKTNGIVEIDGVKYFYRNGTAAAAGLITVDGKVYYADTNGEILTNCTYNVEMVDPSAKHLGTGIYTFGSDGALLWESDKIYALNFDGTASKYDILNLNGSLTFNGTSYDALTKQTVRKGLVNTAVYAVNDSESAAYARTLFAFEAGSTVRNELHFTQNENLNIEWICGENEDERLLFNIDGVDYVLGVITYSAPLTAGGASEPGIYQWYMDRLIDGGLPALMDGYQVKFLNQTSASAFTSVTAEYAASLFDATIVEEPEDFGRKFIACDIVNHSIVVYDLDACNGDYQLLKNDETAVVWEWDADEDPNCTGAPGYGLSSAKIRYSSYYQKDVVIACSSNGWWGIIDYNACSLICEGTLISGPHSMELLPNGDLIVGVSSNPMGVYYIPLSLGSTEPIHSIESHSCHGVSWDPLNECLWVLDYDEVYAVTIENMGTAQARLVRDESRVCTIRRDVLGYHDGHALSPVAGAPGKYWISTVNYLYLFDTETMEASLEFDRFNTLNKYAIKGIASFDDGTVVESVYNLGGGAINYFACDGFRIVSREIGANGEYTDVVTNVIFPEGGRQFYKIQPFTKSYQ